MTAVCVAWNDHDWMALLTIRGEQSSPLGEHQANTYPEKKSSVVNTLLPLIAPVNLRTYHRKSFWNTPSPAMQNSEHNALSRDLVVLDCHPPSKIVSEVSSTMAILLPWRYTVDTPSFVTTCVLPDDQFLSAWIAAHICCSILRI